MSRPAAVHFHTHGEISHHDDLLCKPQKQLPDNYSREENVVTDLTMQQRRRIKLSSGRIATPGPQITSSAVLNQLGASPGRYCAVAEDEVTSEGESDEDLQLDVSLSECSSPSDREIEEEMSYMYGRHRDGHTGSRSDMSSSLIITYPTRPSLLEN